MQKKNKRKGSELQNIRPIGIMFIYLERNIDDESFFKLFFCIKLKKMRLTYG